ncbi:MAG: hypothetical protein AABX47_01945 [Nanoarchaeota archaeon]
MDDSPRILDYQRSWCKFVDSLRADRLRTLIKRYEEPTIPLPTTYEYLSDGPRHVSYSTGLGAQHPFIDQLEEMIYVIENIAKQRNVQVCEGSISDVDGMLTPPYHEILFFAADDVTGERTRDAFEGWIREVMRLPDGTQIDHNLSGLNSIFEPRGEAGPRCRIAGFYAFAAEGNVAGYTFLGAIKPTSRLLLGKCLSIPLVPADREILEERILEMIRPLNERYETGIK